MPPNILMIGAESEVEGWLRAHPALADAEIDRAMGSAHAFRLLRQRPYDAVVTDQRPCGWTKSWPCWRR